MLKLIKNYDVRRAVRISKSYSYEELDRINWVIRIERRDDC